MVFSTPSFTTVGDNYVKRRVKDERNQGKSFVTVSGKIGHNPDALFDKEFKSLHEGDRFVELSVAERRYKNEKLKKNITSTGFRYSNPSAKAVGLGNYYGTIQKLPFRHETDFIVPRKGEAPPHPKPLARPIYTQPTKCGTFGFPNTTISKIGTDYIASFYGQERANAAKERATSQKLMKGAPFKPSGRTGGTFDAGENTGVSTCFMMTKPMSPRKVKPAPTFKKPDQPWRPCGLIDQSIKVEYREDPYDKFDPRVGVKKKGQKASLPTDRASWKPNSSTDNFWYSCSIAFKRL